MTPKESRRKRIRPPVDRDLLTQWISCATAEKNTVVRRKLKDSADLGSLVPVAFFALGLLAFLQRPEMPRWNEWWWYGYRIFLDFES